MNKRYINDKLDQANGDSKEVWKVYNLTTRRTKVKETIEPDMMNQNKANKCNTYFATIGLEIQKKLKNNNQPPYIPENQTPSHLNFKFKPESISNTVESRLSGPCYSEPRAIRTVYMGTDGFFLCKFVLFNRNI